MLTRRKLMPLAAAAIAASTLPISAMADGFIALTDNGEFMTNEMPADETVVEVRLTDGATGRAWYSQNIMENGDWEFVELAADQDEPGEEANSISHLVAAWRPLA